MDIRRPRIDLSVPSAPNGRAPLSVAVSALGGIISALFVLGCGATPSAGVDSAASASATDPTLETSEAPSEGPAEGPAENPAPNELARTDPDPDRSSPSATAPSVPTAADAAALCERLCGRVEAECKEPAAEGCRASCKDYLQTWERCPVEVEEALTCQAEAQDAMLCANVAAASCVPTFSELAQCRAGRQPPKPREATAASEAEQERVPDGWQRLEDAELGISLLLPSGAAREEGAVQLSVQEGDLTYVVESPPPLKGEPTDKALLKAVLDYVGTACHKALKVHGRFETGDVVHIHFDTTCKDGTHWRGMLHVSHQRTVATSARSGTPFTTEEAANRLEALFYGFRFLPR